MYHFSRLFPTINPPEFPILSHQERGGSGLPLSDLVEILDYDEPMDAISDTSGEYALVQDALPAGRVQRVHSTVKRDAVRPGMFICAYEMMNNQIRHQ